MKWVYKIVLAICIILTCVAAAGSVFFFNRVNGVYDENNNNVFSNPRYHVSMIIKSHNDIYWDSFTEGATKAGKDYNIAIEYNPISNWDTSGEAAERINIACKSKVDGIIVVAENTQGLSKAIDDAAQEGVNIVVGVAESTSSSRLAYVGTNFYEYGVKAGKLIKQAAEGEEEVKLAVILSSSNNEETDTIATTQNDVMLNGLNSILQGNEEISLVSTMRRSNDMLGAVDLTKDILAQYPDVDIIFCTNAKDTLAAARVIVSRNLVDQVKIVGTDITDDIKRYIDINIIYGTLDRNGYEAGYNSIMALYKSIGSTFQSSYIDIKVDTYTEDNIENYR